MIPSSLFLNLLTFLFSFFFFSCFPNARENFIQRKLIPSPKPRDKAQIVPCLLLHSVFFALFCSVSSLRDHPLSSSLTFTCLLAIIVLSTLLIKFPHLRGEAFYQRKHFGYKHLIYNRFSYVTIDCVPIV